MRVLQQSQITPKPSKSQMHADRELFELEHYFQSSAQPSEVWEGRGVRSALTSATTRWITDLASWKYILTLTFRDQTSSERARRLFKRLTQALNKVAFGNHYSRKVGHSYFSYVAGIECQVRGTFHLHILLDAPIKWSLAKSVWWQWAGIADLQSIRNVRGAARYISKSIYWGGFVEPYVAKKQCIPDPLPLWWKKRLSPNSK